MRSSLDLSTTWWRVAYPHLQMKSSAQLTLSDHGKLPRKWIYITHTHPYIYINSTPDFGIFFKALKNIHSNMQIERVFGRLWEEKKSSSWVKEKPPPPVLCCLTQVPSPGTAGRSTRPALVSRGRRARREPAAASCISLAKPQSASRWHSRRHAGKLHYRHPRSAPSAAWQRRTVAQRENTYLTLVHTTGHVCTPTCSPGKKAWRESIQVFIISPLNMFTLT